MNWWLRLFRRRRLEAELSAELRFHFDQQVADNLRAGMTEEEARRAARLEFGGVEQVAEECRDARGTGWLESTRGDVRFGARVLAKNPKFAAVAIVTLALGIGANTAIFSVVKAVLLNQLPYRDPDRVVALDDRIDHATVYAWRNGTRSLESISVWGDSEAALEQNGVPTVLRGSRVNYDFLDTLGVRVAMGRAFTPDEELPERDRVMILTHEGWKRHFPGDPNPVGRAFYSPLHGYSIRVIGVLPEGFRPLRMSNPGESPEYFLPLGKDIAREVPSGGGNVAIARLKPGVSVAQAQAELNAKMRRRIEEYPLV
ncbi:MAG TPA: permease prefix domain 1-containing protein [Bryobacteraceae bacterium]|nr:permease prefix domain 1-containing protein [Bryobacteraceae bacterium]